MNKVAAIFAFLSLFATLSLAQQKNSAEPPSGSPSLSDLRWQLNMVMTQQLAYSLPDSLNGKVFLKGFAFSYATTDSLTMIEVPELRRKVEDGTTNGGSKYYLPLQDIDIQAIKIVTTPDEKFTALVIPAVSGKTFLHRPYGNEPDRQVPAVTIGWYDRLQDRTLARALSHLQSFLAKFGE
ncbi:MAG: hypothetical protein MUC59_16285 [Saprospiraceae bacterium]|nr:hypothetical protein [Saprospiraceae bacterium]